MQKHSFQSKNKEVPIEKVLEELGVTENEILIKKYEEKSGLFGKKYTLEAVLIKDIAEYGKELLIELLNSLNKQSKVETKIRDKSIKYEIFSKDNSILIGKNGHILNSIQNYIRQVILNQTDFHVNIQVDIQGYKEKQHYFLEKKVKRIAREVTLTKGRVELDPMNSYERKLVHDALQGFKYIKSDSEGEEPNRRVVISYTEENI